MTLTDTAIRQAKPADKARKLFDGRGLYLLILATGGKYWRLKYRFGGKEKLLALGTYPEIGLREARERREEARKLLAHSIDPGAERQAAKAAAIAAERRDGDTFEAVAGDSFGKYSPVWAVITLTPSSGVWIGTCSRRWAVGR